ncbi:hypothetical protein HRR83_002439 [Exophiala dermatitidis]|uniref:Uncharacterized protein n=1 Tax=Exophiala dermatitidis TaxID=5970 RepID=A0AAN6EZ81_EXODE|nr:hypothetical protein HRR74_002517 [Exophiala dermatitidis]KAJ4525409.1 hypothetical protein HRR73_002138 [Exophiala dermatitidis]KAJ4536724.1 hypothetical protein HRR76_004750 [Exophiala dermatitidis]KAJ4555673.1 hypothetical protein HRR77_001603 [Exophiala dermatitidis]KAJ4568976.1 hypothetical protein HRR81_006634 [Exophiala dermatitidis]
MPRIAATGVHVMQVLQGFSGIMEMHFAQNNMMLLTLDRIPDSGFHGCRLYLILSPSVVATIFEYTSDRKEATPQRQRTADPGDREAYDRRPHLHNNLSPLRRPPSPPWFAPGVQGVSPLPCGRPTTSEGVPSSLWSVVVASIRNCVVQLFARISAERVCSNVRQHPTATIISGPS